MFPRFAVNQLWWLAAGGAGVAARYVRLRGRTQRLTEFDDRTADLLHQQELYGYNAHSLVSIAPGARLWSCPETQGAITYNEYGKVWLVPGDPLVSPDKVGELARRFVEAAQAEGRIVTFMPATERFALAAASLDMRALKISAAPYFDLTTWGPRGDKAKKARAGVNQARRAGVRVTQVRSVDQKLKRETASLSRSWLKARRCAMKLGWLFALDPLHHAERKKFFTARDAGGRLVGFLAASPIPAREGWYLEDVLRLPDAPSGTADLLVVEALSALKREGAKLATLGTSPLATEGSVDPRVDNNESVARVVRWITGRFAVIYNFEGLRRFKSKFAPSWWESEYILFPRELSAPPQIVRAFIKAIAPEGASKMIRLQIARAFHPEPQLELAPEPELMAVPNASSYVGGPLIPRVFMNQESTKPESVESGFDFSRVGQAGRNYLGQFVSVNGRRLHYVSKGSGRPVVFLHGNPGSHHDYAMVLGAVAQSYRTFAFDRPGHGYSERHDSTSAPLEVQSRVLHEAFRRLSIEKPLVVGHSWGGSLALAMAVARSDALAGLVLLAPAAYPSDDPQWWTYLTHIPLLGGLVLRTFAPLIGRGIVRESLKDAYHPEPVPPDYAELAEALWTRPDQIRACANDDRSLDLSLQSLSQRYAEIDVPVLIITGDSDRLVRAEQHAIRLHETIPRAELIGLEQTGHQIPQTRPESVIAAIDRAWELVAQR